MVPQRHFFAGLLVVGVHGSGVRVYGAGVLIMVVHKRAILKIGIARIAKVILKIGRF